MPAYEVTIYTDGACRPNPGQGGYGAVLAYGDSEKEISRGFRRTTNNRMELLAVVAALEQLKRPCRALVYTDSRYIENAVNKGWARRWQARGWRRNNKGDMAQNPDLWERLLVQIDRHEATVRWVKGHAGVAGNERADRLAVAAREGQLGVDAGYERARGPD